MGTRPSEEHPPGTSSVDSVAATTIPAELADACADVAAAGDADLVAGTRPGYVAAPASTAEAAALLAAAARLGLTVVARGSGSRQHWGSPPTRCDLVVDTRRLDRVIEHAAGDLVVQVQAGVALDDLAAVLATAGQQLALDPSPSAANGTGTVGGVLATNSTGPLRFRFGAPRDLLIGITVVRPDGVVARSGGKVVKNVAGYDLGKLFAGSYGTLGLITEATFRLHPLPRQSSWLTVELPDPESAAEVVYRICASPLWPSAVELDWPSANAPLAVSVLLQGDEASVAARSARMQDLLGRGTAGTPSGQRKRPDGDPVHPTPPVEGAGQGTERQATELGNREVADGGAAGGPFPVARPSADGRDRPEADVTRVRVAFWAGQLGSVLKTIRTAAVANGVDPDIRGSAGAGIVEVGVAADVGAAEVGRFVAELRAGLAALSAGGVVPSVASAVVMWAPPEVRAAVDVWGPVPSLQLMRAVKDQFDPEHRMAPGRFAGGI
jgi:glycolate oxidase FAD binding subunit